MKISAENGDYGNLYDADGNLILYPVSADLVTGRVVTLVKDYDHNFMCKGEEGEIRRMTALYKAPLTFKRYRKDTQIEE